VPTDPGSDTKKVQDALTPPRFEFGSAEDFQRGQGGYQYPQYGRSYGRRRGGPYDGRDGIEHDADDPYNGVDHVAGADAADN